MNVKDFNYFGKEGVFKTNCTKCLAQKRVHDKP